MDRHAPTSEAQQHLDGLAKSRILILDGAMGTMIQQLGFGEADYRGRSSPPIPATCKAATTCCRSRSPRPSTAIHRGYLEAGADIVSTNTFNANRISLADYGLADQVRPINRAAVACGPADAAANVGCHCGRLSQSRFVAGSIGPTNRTASLSPDVNDPGYRAVTFDELAAAYYEQAAALVDGGADILLAETVFDTLNLKACLFAIEDLFDDAADRAAGDGLGDDHRPQRPHALRARRSRPSGLRSSMPIC